MGGGDVSGQGGAREWGKGICTLQPAAAAGAPAADLADARPC